MDAIITAFVVFFAVIDPIGSVPVFLAVSAGHDPAEHAGMAWRAVGVAAAVLMGFVLAGQLVLEAMQVPLSAFQIAGGIVLFLFALTMIFGESKPEEEVRIARDADETAVFPLAVPSIASPGAMLAAVVLTDNARFAVWQQAQTVAAMLAVLAITLVLLLLARRIHRLIGESGASIVSRVMGLILSAVATTSILAGFEAWWRSTGL